MNLNQIRQISVYAKDLDEAITFYRDKLGAKFLQKFDPPGLVFFDFSGTRLLLEQNGPKATLYFTVDDIDAAVDHLRAEGITVFDGPTASKGPAEGNRWIYFLSPWGMQFELVSYPHGKAWQHHPERFS